MKKIALYAVIIFGTSLQAIGQEVDSTRKVVPSISSADNTEFSPTISADGQTLIYEADVDKKKGWELFESHLDSLGNWGEPYPLKNINEKCQFLAGPSLSYDGNTLYFTAFIEGVTQSEDIYFSTRLDEKNWSEPQSIGAPINTEEGYEGFPSISADGNALYFIRTNEEHIMDKKSKESCFIIFVSHRTEAGTWGEPVPLPEPINLGCERDPKIMADNQTLIFSSTREGGKGKYDMYQTQKLANGEWAAPVPLDFINGDDNDQAPCISASGDVIFFYTNKDIYEVKIPPAYRQLINVIVKGTVKSEKTQEALSANIIVKNTKTGEQFTQTNNPNDGKFTLVLRAGQHYSITFMNPIHLSDFVDLDLEKQDRYGELHRDVFLQSEYTLELTVNDPDLKEPMKAHVFVKGDQTIYADTASLPQYPLKLTLKTIPEYDLASSASLYPQVKEKWKFDPMTTRRVMKYTMNLPHEKSKYIAAVTSIVTGQKVKVKVTFRNETVNEVVVAEPEEVVYLRKKDRYEVLTSSDKGYLFSTQTIVAGEGEMDANGNYIITIKVVPIEPGALLTLNNITFASNSADINPSSYPDLNLIIEMMAKNPTLTIEISAHTDDIGAEDFNQALSERRAQSVLKYLTKGGTKADRLESVGYGKKKPLVENDSDENRALNRRVELRVLKVS